MAEAQNSRASWWLTGGSGMSDEAGTCRLLTWPASWLRLLSWSGGTCRLLTWPASWLRLTWSAS
jgi:hypothetical protein